MLGERSNDTVRLRRGYNLTRLTPYVGLGSKQVFIRQAVLYKMQT